MLRKKIAFRATLLVAIHIAPLSLLGCSRSENLTDSHDSTVTIAYCCGREALSPSADMSARYLVFLPLVELDGDGERMPRLARSWSHSADYQEWTYHLRTDARWDDGVPVTARDVKFSLDLLAHPEVGYLPADLSVSLQDEFTVTVRSAGWFVNANDSWLGYWPKHILEGLDPAGFYEWDFWTHPVGNGPYRFVRYVPETMMAFEPNPHYYDPPPRIERVVLKFAGAAGLAELLSGNVDAITENDPADILKLAADPRFQVHHGVADTVSRAIVWNNAHPVLRRTAVRRALTLAIDRRALLAALNLPNDLPIVDGPYTSRQFLRRDLPDPLPYDPETARELLEKAGWRDGDGDGIRERDGAAFRFTALVIADASLEPGGLGLATLIQGQLREIGVHMEIQALEPSLVFSRLKSGEFDAALTVFQNLPGWLQRFFVESHGIGFEDSEVRALINQANTTADPEIVGAVYRQLMEIFRRELPVTFLFPRTETYFVHRRIRGLGGRHWPDPVLHMEHLRYEQRSER